MENLINEVLKKLRREILKQAKKNEFHYYWDISDLDKYTVAKVIMELENEGKIVKNKGANFKIIYW